MSATTTAAEPALPARPFAVPASLAPGLSELRVYWNSLKRGSATIPFADDLKLSDAGQLSNRVLLNVFETPRRFRFNIVEEQIARLYGGELTGQFADEVPARPPLDYFLSQCAATVEAHAPTFYLHAPLNPGESEYERMLFPLWADGHIGALVGAIHVMTFRDRR